jgi:hypothetical protein
MLRKSFALWADPVVDRANHFDRPKQALREFLMTTPSLEALSIA